MINTKILYIYLLIFIIVSCIIITSNVILSKNKDMLDNINCSIIILTVLFLAFIFYKIITHKNYKFLYYKFTYNIPKINDQYSQYLINIKKAIMNKPNNKLDINDFYNYINNNGEIKNDLLKQFTKYDYNI